VNVAGGHVNNLDGTMYGMASMQTFSVSTPRGSSMEPHGNGACIEVHYNGGSKNALQVDMLAGLSAHVMLPDIDSLIQCLPAPSANAYSLHWIQSAIEMEKFAYCMETMERLEQVGNFLNINLALGPTDIVVGHFEVSLESVRVSSVAENDTLLEIRRIYGLMKSLVASVGDGERSIDLSETLHECIHILEERLLYKTMEISVDTAGILHDGYTILEPLRGILGVKLNRLFGDFSHPQVMLDVSSGSILLDMYNAALASLMDIQSSFMAIQDVPKDDARADETMSIRIQWPRMQLRWLDDGFETQSRVVSGEGHVSVRTSSVHMNRDINVSVHNIELLQTNGMKNIDIPLMKCSIPYVARMISLESVDIGVMHIPCSTKISMKTSGISLIGEEERDCSNFIRSRKLNESSSIEVSYVEENQQESVDISVSNIDIGHGTVLRSSLISQMFPEGEESQDAAESKDMVINFVCKNVRCSFVHSDEYDAVQGLPVQYQEFSEIYSTIATIDLRGAHVVFHIGERMSLNCFAFERFSTCCGFLGEQGASMSVIFEVPDVGGDMNGSLLTLHCPAIQFGIHPHQVLLLKGVSDLIEYEMTRLGEFYGIGMHEVERPVQNETLSFQFDPISLNIDVLRLGIFGALPSAGAMCLKCSSIFVDIRPGFVQSSWDSLDLLLYIPAEEKYDSDTDSISDGSSACHSANIGISGISPGLSSAKNSSVFLDTASVASRGLSESSFISKYYLSLIHI